MEIILQILTLLGAVTLFLFGLNLLSNGLQKVAGDGMRRILAAMTSNPFKQILTGIGVTALIQSSTATTIMVVSFVNAGLLELGQAIGVIMGANIGTTITAWIMAVFGFSFNMADFAYPLLLLGYILLHMTKSQKKRDTGEIIIGFALFFIGFAALRSTAQLLITPEKLGFLASWSNLGWWSILVFMLIGIVLTACFQSSAATMAITMILITTGVVNFELATAIIMGANIGTTITAWIMAVFGFSFNMADFAYPLLLFGYILLQMKKSQKRHDTGEIIIGFALFFIGFAALRSTAQLLITPEKLGFLASWSNLGWWSILVFMLIGIVLTACFQSSAATMAITMILDRKSVV